MLYLNRKMQFQTKITEINTDGADLLKKGFYVSRGVLPLKEKGWWKFLFLSVLSDYFVYRKVIYTFTNYNLPQISLDRCHYTSNTYLHLSCPYRRRQLKEGNMAFSFISKKTTFSTSTPKAFFGLKKTDFLLSCSVSCANQGSCRSANFLENPGFPTFAAARWRQIQQLIGFYSQMVLSI